MREGDNVLGSMFSGGGSEDTSIYSYLFPKKFEDKKAVSEVTPDLIYPLAVAGLIQKRFKSTAIKQFLDEFYTLEIAKDRKSRVEIVEVGLASRRSMDMGDEP